MTVEKKYRPRCFFDVEIGGQNIGRIVFELYSDVCPITCENFRCLCTGEKGIGKCTGKPLHYKSTIFHRIVKGFMVQGGDFSAGNGSGGESIYGGTFPDENFDLNHDSTFCLSMANRGKDTNGSQFFITTLPAPHLDGVHVVFGHVISGQEIVSEVENQLTDQSSRPFTDVRIFNCGELVLKSKSKSKHRNKDKAGSPLEEGEMSDEKSKHKKKHKKHSKKSKKEKSRRKEDDELPQNDMSRSKREMDLDCSVRADEIPDIPTNNFLMRRGPVESEEPRRPPYRPEGYLRRTKISKSGRKIKGRGHMRYRTPSPEGSRSGSETPPHWRQAQSRVRSLKEVLEEKRKLLEELEAQESNEEEPQETQAQKLPAEELSDRFHKGHRDISKEQYDFHRREELEALQDHRTQELRSGSSRHHSERSATGARGHLRDRVSSRREEASEGRGGRESGRGRERRSHRRREESEEDYDSSTSPVRKGMQSTVISKVVYQNKPSEIVTTPAVRVVRRFTEDKQNKPKHDEREKRNRSSSFNNKSPSGPHSKHGLEEGERNGVGGHRHHHRHHHRHKSEKGKPTSEATTEDAHAELGQSPMASLEVDKDTSIVDMDCTPIIHQPGEEESAVASNAEKKLPPEDYVSAPVPPVIEKRELYKEPEPKVNDSPRIRIPGLGSDDESDGSVEEEPPPPPGTEDIVLFKNYPPTMPPVAYVAESKEQQDVELYDTAPRNVQQEQFIPVPPSQERVVAAAPEYSRQKLPFLDDDTEDESTPPTVTTTSVTSTATVISASPLQKAPPSPGFMASSLETAKQVILEKEAKEKSPSPRKIEVKDVEKTHVSTKPAESSSHSGQAERSSSSSRAPRRRSRSRSPRRGSSSNQRRSLSRGRKRMSPAFRNRSPIWRRSSDYRRPTDVGRRRRSPSPSRRRSRSHSRSRSRRSPPRYNRRRSRSVSRSRRGKRSRSSSSSSSSSSNSSRHHAKRGRKPSRSRSSSSSSSHSSSSSTSSSSSS